MDDETEIDANFVRATDKFRVTADTENDVLGVAGIGISFAPTKALELGLGYKGEFGSDYDNQIVNLGFSYKF